MGHGSGSGIGTGLHGIGKGNCHEDGKELTLRKKTRTKEHTTGEEDHGAPELGAPPHKS